MVNTMYNEERQHAIWKQVEARGRVSVKELSDEFGVTAETIRRDLTVLEQGRLVRRVHGGAILANRLVFEPTLEDRTQHMAAEKERIAGLARDELPSSGAILVDAGSTTAKLVETPVPDAELTIVTNSIPIAQAAIRWPMATVMTVGGRVRQGTLAEVDDWALRSLAELRVDVAFVAANAVSLERGLGTPDAAEAAVKRAILAAADRIVLLADHTKFDAESMLTYGSLREVDTVITGRELDDERVNAMKDLGVRVVLA